MNRKFRSCIADAHYKVVFTAHTLKGRTKKVLKKEGRFDNLTKRWCFNRLDAHLQLMQAYLDTKPNNFDGFTAKYFLPDVSPEMKYHHRGYRSLPRVIIIFEREPHEKG